jgi:hypothetical protein
MNVKFTQNNKILILFMNKTEYYGGEEVIGKAIIQTNTTESFRIYLSYKGYEHSEFNQNNGGNYCKEYKSTRYFYHKKDILLNKEIQSFKKGIYEFPFTFLLPKNLPQRYKFELILKFQTDKWTFKNCLQNQNSRYPNKYFVKKINKRKGKE